MNYEYSPGYYQVAGGTGGYPPNNPYSSTSANHVHPLIANGSTHHNTTQSSTQREPPMLTMIVSDPEETGGPGCAVAGISRERMGACFKYTWVREWKYPSTDELLFVQQRLLDFLIQYGLRQADMCEALGLVTTYMSLFLKDVHSSNLGSRRRAEMFCVLNEFFQLIDEEAFDMEAIFRVRARRRHADRCFRLPEESVLPVLPPDNPADTTLDRPIPQFAGISRRHGGRLFKYSSVQKWLYPSPQECTDLRDAIMHLLNATQVKPVDLADGLGLVAPYLVHFLSEPFHPLVGRKRRGELFSVCTTYLRLIETGAADVVHLQLLRDLRRASENTVRNSRAPAPVYKRGTTSANGMIDIKPITNNINPVAKMQMIPMKDNDTMLQVEPAMMVGNSDAPDASLFGVMRATPINANQPQNIESIQEDPQAQGYPCATGLQYMNVPGLKVGGRPVNPRPLSEEGLTEHEFSQLLMNGPANSVPLDVAFSNHLSKWVQPLAMGGGDTRSLTNMPADWRGTDMLLYQHPEGRVLQTPDSWNTRGNVKLNQEAPAIHPSLHTPNDYDGSRNSMWNAQANEAHMGMNHPHGNGAPMQPDMNMSEIWQWQKIAQGFQTSDENVGPDGEVLPNVPYLPHWNPAEGSQESHIYRYLFNQWRDVISHACAVYQSQGRAANGNESNGMVNLPYDPNMMQHTNPQHVIAGDYTGMNNAARMPEMNSEPVINDFTAGGATIKIEDPSSYALAEVLPSNWNANQITSTFLSYHLWVDGPVKETTVFSKWEALAQGIEKMANEKKRKEPSNVEAIENMNKTDVLSIDSLSTALTDCNVEHLNNDHDSFVVALCVVVNPSNAPVNPKAPGDRIFELNVTTDLPDLNSYSNPTKRVDDWNVVPKEGLFCSDTFKFLDQFRQGNRGGEGVCGREGIDQHLTESCLLPHHEWTTAGSNDELSSLEFIAETRLGRELGMNPTAVERCALGLRRQMLAIHRVMRCYRVARNAVHHMGLSGAVSTLKLHMDGHKPPYPPSHVADALGQRAINFDIILEDEQCRVKYFTHWDMVNTSFNKFAEECVNHIMINANGEATKQSAMNVGGSSLYSLMCAHQGFGLESARLNHEFHGPRNKLPERVRNAIDIGVRRAMMTIVSDYCNDVHSIWKEFKALNDQICSRDDPEELESTNAGGGSNLSDSNLTEGFIDDRNLASDMMEETKQGRFRETLLLKTAPIEFSEFAYPDVTDLHENLPYFMLQLWKAIHWMGSVNIPEQIEVVLNNALGRQLPEDVPMEIRARELFNLYSRLGVLATYWDPYSSLRQTKERLVSQQRMQAQQAEARRLAQQRMALRQHQHSPSSMGHQQVPSPATTEESDDKRGPRRSNRVRAAKQQISGISLREKLGLSSSDSSDVEDDRFGKRPLHKKKKGAVSDSEDEEAIWDDEDSEDEEEGSEEEDVSE